MNSRIMDISGATAMRGSKTGVPGWRLRRARRSIPHRYLLSGRFYQRKLHGDVPQYGVLTTARRRHGAGRYRLLSARSETMFGQVAKMRARLVQREECVLVRTVLGIEHVFRTARYLLAVSASCRAIPVADISSVLVPVCMTCYLCRPYAMCPTFPLTPRGTLAGASHWQFDQALDCKAVEPR
ncbi:uncharacterized protein B0H18DRAFT_1025134 [Fomitopsis serialis]|uniref:uncharacterized protein n=1 Tax=Fomitopsis serialis TaxID=139415 RepID=UPI0020073DE6|nr:uncharacterized protein B0H18DRAFT_1025134 [Neoantrodia serialis]KAH9920117.1 hypothetical protein B0H18DRAFT_1025134 [Neoantrodia serialis]